jgi:hypothetical protein
LHGRERAPLALIIILAAACDPERAAVDIPARVSLSTFDSCDALERHIEDRAVAEMRAELAALEENGFLDPPNRAPPPAGETVDLIPHRGGRTLQADRLTTDGTHAYVVEGQALIAARIEPLSIERTSPVTGSDPRLVDGGRFLGVLTTVEGGTRIEILAKADLSSRVLEVPGHLVDAKAEGERATIIVEGGIDADFGRPFAPSRLEAIEDRSLGDDLEDTMRARSLEDWLEPVRGFERDCTAFAHPTAPVPLGLVRVLSVDLASATFAERAVIGSVSAAEVGPTGAAIVLPHWWPVLRPGQVGHSYAFTFDSALSPRASGGFDGEPVDLDLEDGRLRAIATIERREPDAINTWGRAVRSHHAVELVESGGVLESRSTGELAGGDWIRGHHLGGGTALISFGLAQSVAVDFARESLEATPVDLSFDRAERFDDGRILFAEGGAVGIASPDAIERMGQLRVADPTTIGTATLVDFDVARGLVALPAPASPEAPPGGGGPEIDIVDVTAGRIRGVATVDVPVSNDQLEAPAFRTSFLEDRILTLSAAGIDATWLDGSGQTASLLYP